MLSPRHRRASRTVSKGTPAIPRTGLLAALVSGLGTGICEVRFETMRSIDLRYQVLLRLERAVPQNQRRDWSTQSSNLLARRARVKIGAVLLFDPARFEDLVPRFLGALRKLARQGLLSKTSEALDILHDFYLDAWSGVVRRYDPDLGPFDRYAIASLSRFARVRAIRDASLRARLSRDWEREAWDTKTDDNLHLDEERVAQAVQQLSDEKRTLLALAYGDNLSDRDLARRFEVSRYIIRVRLAEALAAVAAQVDAPSVASTKEAALARALFVDGEPIELAAADVGLPLPRARAIRRALLARFARIAGETRR